MPQHNIITTEDDDNCLVLTITDEDASQDEDTPIDNSYNIFSWEFITAATEQKTTVADCLKKLEDVLNNQLPNGAGNPIHIKFDLNNTNNEVSIIEQQGSFPLTAYVNSKTTRVNQYTIMHDIGHVLGITSLLYSAKCQEDSGVTYYTGENALREYKQYYNNSENTDDSNNLIGIPLSSNKKHLEKTEHGYTNNIFHPALANELMTDIGEAQEEENLALSKITIGCLEDLGYAVDYDKADDYNLLPFTQENNIFKWSFNNNIAKNKYKQITYKCMNRWQAVLAERLPDNSLYKIEIEIRDHQYEAGSTTQGAAGITKVQLNNGRTFSREGFVALNKEKTVNFLEVVLLHEIWSAPFLVDTKLSSHS